MLNKLYSLATEPIYFNIISFVNFISRHVDLIHEVSFISVRPRDNQHLHNRVAHIKCWCGSVGIALT